MPKMLKADKGKINMTGQILAIQWMCYTVEVATLPGGGAWFHNVNKGYVCVVLCRFTGS